MDDEIVEIVRDIRSEGYDSIYAERGYDSITSWWSRDENYDRVIRITVPLPVPEEYQPEPKTGWRDVLPDIIPNPNKLVPDDLRSIAEEYDWEANADIRDEDTIDVFISEKGLSSYLPYHTDAEDGKFGDP